MKVKVVKTPLQATFKSNELIGELELQQTHHCLSSH